MQTTFKLKFKKMGGIPVKVRKLNYCIAVVCFAVTTLILFSLCETMSKQAEKGRTVPIQLR